MKYVFPKSLKKQVQTLKQQIKNFLGSERSFSSGNVKNGCCDGRHGVGQDIQVG